MALGPVVRRWQDEGVIAEVVEAVAAEALEQHAERPAGELLDAWGVEVETVVADVVEGLRPALEHAHASGFLEERVRAHLEPFYASLPSMLEAPPARKPATTKAPAKKTAATKAPVKKTITKKPPAKKAATKKAPAKKAGAKKPRPSAG